MQLGRQTWNGREYSRIFFILALSKTCIIRRQTCNLNIRHATSNVKNETCNTSREIYNLSRKVRNLYVKHETDENIREYSLFWLYPKHATSDVKHATPMSDMQHRTLNMKLATLHMKYTISHVKFATWTSNMKRARIFFILFLSKTCNILCQTCKPNVRYTTTDVKYELTTFHVKYATYSTHSTSNVKPKIETLDMQQLTLNLKYYFFHFQFLYFFSFYLIILYYIILFNFFIFFY